MTSRDFVLPSLVSAAWLSLIAEGGAAGLVELEKHCRFDYFDYADA